MNRVDSSDPIRKRLLIRSLRNRGFMPMPEPETGDDPVLVRARSRMPSPEGTNSQFWSVMISRPMDWSFYETEKPIKFQPADSVVFESCRVMSRSLGSIFQAWIGPDQKVYW